MSALQYSDVPGYAALLLRPTLSELQLAGGLIELSQEWLGATRASWSADTRTWRFPGPGPKAASGGASLTFGYLANGDDLGRYAGTSFSYLGFDELTRFDESHYRRMFRVLRQPSAALATSAGIWEVRGPTRHFTHSKVMAWVAFDCAVRFHEDFGRRDRSSAGGRSARKSSPCRRSAAS
jgi:Glycosyl hydrolases family 15/Terminase large subunit, T4likevirus-type, N-terminal